MTDTQDVLTYLAVGVALAVIDGGPYTTAEGAGVFVGHLIMGVLLVKGYRYLFGESDESTAEPEA